MQLKEAAEDFEDFIQKSITHIHYRFQLLLQYEFSNLSKTKQTSFLLMMVIVILEKSLIEVLLTTWDIDQMSVAQWHLQRLKP